MYSRVKKAIQLIHLIIVLTIGYTMLIGHYGGIRGYTYPKASILQNLYDPSPERLYGSS